MPPTPTLPRLPRWLGTLKFKIVALAVVTAVLAAVASTELALNRTRADLEHLMLENERDGGERMAAMIASKLEMLEIALKSVADGIAPEDLADPQALTRMLADKPALGALFESVFVARADGRMLTRLERGKVVPGLPDIADREYFQQALKTDQLVVSKPLRGRVSNNPVVFLVAPVLGADGATRGVLAGSLALRSTRLFADLAGSNPNDRSRLLVIDRAGVVLAHPDPARVLTDAALEPGLAPELARWRAAGSPIDTRGAVSLSTGHLVSMAGIPLSDWVLVHVTPRDAALAPLVAAGHTARQATWGAALVAALLAGVLAWHLTRPISRLQARAERMLEHDADDARAWPAESGEVGRLADAFKRVVAQRRQQQDETQALLKKLEAVLDHAEVGIALTRNGQFELVSEQFSTVFGCAKPQIVGQPTRMIYASDEAYQALAERAGPAFIAHGAFDGELELVRRSGEVFWARMRGRAVAPGDRSQGTIWAVEDVTVEHARRERLAWTSTHDSLTGLTNRAAFEVLLEQATRRALREPFCALFIDLDRFKQVNDTGGHAAGDALLREVAKVLVAQVRKSDTVARLGGDEFAVLLNDCRLPDAQVLAERMRAAVLAYELPWEGARHRVGASIGMVAVDGAVMTPVEVMRAADTACYAAKRQGRNQVALHAFG